MRRRRRRSKGPAAVVILMVVAVVSVVLLRSAWDQAEHKQYPLLYRECVERESAAFELDPFLVYAVIKAESGFDETAGSSAGACGLMQLMPQTFTWMQTKLGEEDIYTEEDIFDPEVNIHYGCALLRLLIDLYGSEETAVCAYNAGMGNVSDWLEDPALSSDGIHLLSIPYEETRQYLQRVEKNRAMYRELYGNA